LIEILWLEIFTRVTEFVLHHVYVGFDKIGGLFEGDTDAMALL
jgi:hypothetical protein